MSAALELLGRVFSFGGGVVVGALGILILCVILLYVVVSVADAMDACDEDYLS